MAENNAFWNWGNQQTYHEKIKDYIQKNFSNPNLLINSDFYINQKGFQSGTVSQYTYTVDMWSTMNVDTHITVDGDKVAIKHDGSKGYATYGQVVEQLKAGTYTVSADIISADSTIDRITVRIATKDQDTFVVEKTLCTPITEFVPGRYSYTFEVTDDIEGVLVYWYSRITGTPNGEAFVMTKPKLELGSVATPFLPPNPATELLKCQRFYASHFVVKDGFYGTAYANRTNCARLTVALPATIRNLPTIVYTADNLVLVDGVNIIGITALEVHTMMGNEITLSVIAEGLTIGKSYLLLATDNTTIAYSAEL